MISHLIHKFSSFLKLLRVTVFVLRASNNFKKDNDRITGCLCPKELETALLLLVKAVQIECFPLDYKCLIEGKPLHRKSKLLTLNPFLHENVIRMGAV